MTYDEFKQNFLPEFLNINSYAGRMKYADENLQRIGSGTGRAVYDIDGEKVLKLAKNAKGIAQNEAEAGAGYYRDTQHIVTIVFDSEDNNSWLISEKAKKVNEARIKELTGIPSLNDLYYFLRNFKEQNNGRKKIIHQDQELVEFFYENEFAQDLQNFIANYSQHAGDMGRPSTYGEVLRDGQPTIVLTDYGLNDEVYDSHYNRQRKQRYGMHELFNYADGNDDILSDAGGGMDIRHGMWAQMPYSVDDGQGVINENFIKFVSNHDKYPNKPVAGLPVLADHFQNCVNNIKETLKHVENKKQFYGNLLELQNYLIRRGFYDRDPLMSEEYVINEDTPSVDPDTLNDRNYSDKLATAVAIKLNLTSPKYLGGGGNGFAYEINDNLIMKLTTDISEADAASRLMRGQPKNISIIFNLYKVVDTETDKAVFVIMQENINDKPLDRLRKLQADISTIKPDGLDYEDIMVNIKKPKKFNHNEWVVWAKKILTNNPESGVSQQERQAAYEYLLDMFKIRQELLDYRIKSTDYIAIANLGYKNGVLKFFDVGGYYGVGEPEIGDEDIINLPENLSEEQLSEDYPRDRADAIAVEIGKKLGVEPQYIGHGLFGVAYDIGDNKVLKITSDKSEAAENLGLIGKPLKYIAQPYRVFQVNSEVNADFPITYGIILEKLKTDQPYFKRMYDRLEYVFKNIFNIDYKEALEVYLYGHQFDHDIEKSEVDHYFKKNSEDAEFFFSILRIAEELDKYGVESLDYYNAENLGYKKDGAIGFFDVGFGNGFLQPTDAEQMGVNVAEDGSAKFSTDNAIAQDDFPPYNSNDTSPMINNDLDANVASTMYEDLEYNHVVGDATEDKYMLTENEGEKYYRAVEKNMGKTIEFEPEGFYEAIDDDGNPIYQYDTFWESDIAEVAASKTIGGAVMGLYSMFRTNGRNPETFYIYMINEKPDVDISHWDMGDFYHLKEVRYRRAVQGKYIGKLIITDDMKTKLNAFYNMNSLEAYDEPDDETYEIVKNTDYDQYIDNVKGMVHERNKSFGTGSKTVKVKRKCQLAGLGNTSVACNQGDINNLEFGSVNEEDLEIREYFSSLVPKIDEGEIMTLQDLPFRKEVEQLGGKIFSVGGAVRDEFLGKESKDLDVLVTGIPMDSLEQLLKKYGGVNNVGASFGVLKFVPKGSKEEIDIAIPRTEVPTGAGGHQGFDVTSDHELPIEKDLERRDFTINAIAKDIDGNIIDPYNGQEDLKNKIIRIVNPKAFSDDPLRMLRAVQFASRFGFTIEPKTMQMIIDNASKITEIAPERILIELEKIVTKGNALIGVELLASTGLFKQIFGNEIQPSQIGRRDFTGVKTMAELLFLMMNGVVQNPAEFYLSRFSTEDAKRDRTYKELQALDLAFNSDLLDQQMSPVKARSIAHNMYTTASQTLESQVLPEAIAVAAQELLQGKYPKTVNELAVNGNDLMQKGLQGKAIGDMQKSMLIRIYADKIRNNKEELLSLVKSNNEKLNELSHLDFERESKWNINGEEVELDFFIEKYDKWNYKYERFRDPSKESVLRFIEDEFPEFVNDEKLKKELYWALTDRELLNEDEMKKVSYSAVVLDDKSKASLLKVFSPMIPEGWEVIAHHMTIKMGALENGSREKDDMENGTEITLKVNDYAMDELVMAVGVEGYPTTNPKPHITIAVNRIEGGKPFLSNKLTDWKPLGFPITLTGKVSEEG